MFCVRRSHHRKRRHSIDGRNHHSGLWYRQRKHNVYLMFIVRADGLQIVSPTSDVRKLFDILRLETVEQDLPGCTAVLFGHNPCDAPPTIGFPLSDSTRWLDIQPSAFQQANNGDNNCAGIVTGMDLSLINSLWVVGQA